MQSGMALDAEPENETMTITATFSNGYTDTYKGKRDVRAAWMITDRATGEVLASGHSIDAERAQKTAEGKVCEYNLVRPEGLAFYTVPSARDFHLIVRSWKWKPTAKLAREHGYDGERITNVKELRKLVEWCRARNTEYRAAQREMVDIEVITL